MSLETALVVTSISPPNDVLRALAAGCRERGMGFYLIGDVRSPADFALDGCDFYSLARQEETGLSFAALCPRRHYARKNIGYLLAMRSGAQVILETDDDNFPRPGFWEGRSRFQKVPRSRHHGAWVNTYAYFTDAAIWPRGLPLDAVKSAVAPYETLPIEPADCPIQQGLVDENPDVDAIYRLLLPLPLEFRGDRRVALGPGAWCPFNSQNTAWWKEAFPLLYLPAYCSFRMTDIWRSLVAQRIGWANGWSVLFHEATVWQARNEHDLMRDFQDEVPGYLQNRRIGEVLAKLDLPEGRTSENLRCCYEALVRSSLLDPKELPLLEAWLADLDSVMGGE